MDVITSDDIDRLDDDARQAVREWLSEHEVPPGANVQRIVRFDPHRVFVYFTAVSSETTPAGRDGGLSRRSALVPGIRKCEGWPL